MFKDFPLIKESKKTITQFYPHIPKAAGKAVQKVFNGRWIGQGPLVDKLEMIFSRKFAANLPSSSRIRNRCSSPCLHII